MAPRRDEPMPDRAGIGLTGKIFAPVNDEFVGSTLTFGLREAAGVPDSLLGKAHGVQVRRRVFRCKLRNLPSGIVLTSA